MGEGFVGGAHAVVQAQNFSAFQCGRDLARGRECCFCKNEKGGDHAPFHFSPGTRMSEK